VNAEARLVLDASAVLVYLQREPGYERVRDALAKGRCHEHNEPCRSLR